MGAIKFMGATAWERVRSAWVGGSGGFFSAADLGDIYNVVIRELTENLLFIAYTNGSACCARIGTISGSEITLGDEYEFYASAASYLDVAVLSSTKVLIGYAPSSNYGYARVADISGSAISYGTQATFRSGTTRRISLATLDSTHVVITYVAYTGNTGRVRIAVISGSSLSFGTEKTFTSDFVQYQRVTAMSSSVFIVAYPDSLSYYGRAIAGSVSGDTITLSSESTFRSESTDQLEIIAIETDSFFIGYRRSNSISPADSYFGAVVGSVSGTTITFGSNYTLEFVNIVNRPVLMLSTGGTISAYMIDNDNLKPVNVQITLDGTVVGFGTPEYVEPDMENVYGLLLADGRTLLYAPDNATWTYKAYIGTSGARSRCRNIRRLETETWKRARL